VSLTVYPAFLFLQETYIPGGSEWVIPAAPTLYAQRNFSEKKISSTNNSSLQLSQVTMVNSVVTIVRIAHFYNQDRSGVYYHSHTLSMPFLPIEASYERKELRPSSTFRRRRTYLNIFTGIISPDRDGLLDFDATSMITIVM
jgi:hypothetical protein